MEDKHSDIDKILAEREKIDQLLKSKFSKEISIMFTDIKGSTSVYESRGDIDGRAMVHRHNEIVLPILKEYKGELLKTIGDATMTVFDKPAEALSAAVTIQQTLKEFNEKKPMNEQIHLRIGINYGTVIVDKGDVFGDVVNVASRVESLAHADEIYITEDMYQVTKSSDEFIFRYVDAAQVKGKKDALRVYRVLWHEEALSLGKTRAQVHKKAGLFVLEVFRYGQKLKVSGFERKGEERPVTGYKEIKFNESKIKKYTKGIIDLLNRANKRGKIGGDLLVKLKDYGKLLCDELVPPAIKEQLIKTSEQNLMISIDDELVYIPWELLYDGKNFFCQRFSMGRSVKTQQQVSAVSRALGRPLKMQLLADPGGDLKASYEEGVEIKNEMGLLEDWINVSFKSTDISADYVKARIRNFDIVHYAGHAEHDAQAPEKSGWMLSDAKLSAEDIINLKGAMPMPSLVFSNACRSGQTDEWKIEEDCENRIYGLANAFLLAGVQHYIGTFWEIPDQAGSYFATHFYKSILNGDAIGEAVRKARLELMNRYGEDTIVWASYMLYGDPSTEYVHPLMGERKEEPEKKTVKEELVSTDLRHREQVIHLDRDKKTSRSMIYAGLALLLLVIGASFLIHKGAPPWGRDGKIAADSSRREISASVNTEKQKRIDELVASLAEDYRKGNIRQKQTNQVQQASGPLTMVLMDVKSTGNITGDSSEKLKAILPLTLEKEQRIRFVERELLDKLLAELKLSASELADPLTALRIGKLLSARIIITGSIIGDRNSGTVILRCIDTETSEIKKVISAESPSGEIDRKVIDDIGGKIIEWVRKDFPSEGIEKKG
ncbi:MAG: CHAT domain-containing protein [Nitrospiraceae bacterium]|nr:MAG: CHAT domain-containing protein [Nitrospiraceae bacterium]